MIQELKNLVYHEDLNRFTTRKKILIRELLILVLAFLEERDLREIGRDFQVICELFMQGYHE